MRLVQHNPEGVTGIPPELSQHRQEGAQVVDLFGVPRLGKVEHHTDVRIAQGARNVAQPWGRFSAAKHHDARQFFQRRVVPFRIYDPQTIALQY